MGFWGILLKPDLKEMDTLSGEVSVKIVLPPFWKGIYTKS